MHILLPTVVFIAFLAFAPWAALEFAAWFAVVAVTVRAAAKRFGGAEVSLGAAARSLLYAAVLPLFAMLALGAFSAPPGSVMLGGPAALVLVLLAGSLVAAFMLALGTDFKISAAVAAVALVVSVALALLLRAVSGAVHA